MKKIIASLATLAFLAGCSPTSKTSSVSSVYQSSVNPGYWQQHVDYDMNVDMDVKTYKYTGTQELVYTNNSPETLDKVYYHLYFNAFQPGSEMDVRSRTIKDPDGRVGDRISKLTADEIGYLRVDQLSQDGAALNYTVAGTVLEVQLKKPLKSGQKTTFNMNFNGQVPKQIRRSGRDNAEGVALSMTQWYPKLAEYDHEGWHAHPYIGREFHGVWGDFDVTINIDRNYILGGTGYLQNPDKIGYGYEKKGSTVNRPDGAKLSWNFIAPQVHDFTWAADPEYIHDKVTGDNGTVLHFLYKDNPDIKENWKNLQPKTVDLLKYFNDNIGDYPYKQYSVIQGGDGGMEYGMCTLITGGRNFGSLVGVTAHEMAHSWFQFLLATNESKHEWMDEGFTTYTSTNAMNVVMGGNSDNPHTRSYGGYYFNVKSGDEMPLTTHADRYVTNQSYGISAYSKGSVFLSQLGYIIGKENLDATIKKYYQDFKFKHPQPNDIKRTAERVSGMELDWYLQDWAQTTNTIDYSIENVVDANGKTRVTLARKGLMPMPIDLVVEYTDGRKEYHYIPLQMMRGAKKNPYPAMKQTIHPDWAWAYPEYTLDLGGNKASVKSITIDPSTLMADLDQDNNVYKGK